MRIALALLTPLLLLAGCATSGMGPHAHGAQGQAMANCPMASTSDGAHQQGAMMGEGHMMADGHTMPGMQHGDMTNCSMAQQGAEPAASDSPLPADAHQH